jgi:hypothetical protein
MPWKKILKIARKVLLSLLLIGVILLLLQTPRADRNWSPEVSHTVTATIQGHKVVIHDLRDWTYGNSTILAQDWREVTVDPSQIVRVWFIIEPFSSWKAVGHTFLSFEFEDGSALSFSIEARREEGEKYSAIQGTFRKYELAYQWGTERDFVTRRLLYLSHPLRMYPLSISSSTAQAVFVEAIRQTNVLAAKPRFYNTLTDNCTNALAYMVNHIYPKALPLDTSWVFTGYSDRYLMHHGFIVQKGTAQETKDVYDLTSKRADVAQIATSSPALFSTELREILSK